MSCRQMAKSCRQTCCKECGQTGLAATSVPSIEMSGRRCAIQLQIAPSPQPTSRVEAPRGIWEESNSPKMGTQRPETRARTTSPRGPAFLKDATALSMQNASEFTSLPTPGIMSRLLKLR
jgi:hypothetical protein